VAQILGPDFEAGGVELLIEVKPQTITADETMLRQVLVNLLLNSLHASPAGTTVRIVLRRQDRRLQLCVEDQGRGIPAELLPDIFKPYVSGSPPDTAWAWPLSNAWSRLMVGRSAPGPPGQGTVMTISGIKPARETP
jgi:two-component system, NtrC family, sensor histidine kinase HydH